MDDLSYREATMSPGCRVEAEARSWLSGGAGRLARIAIPRQAEWRFPWLPGLLADFPGRARVISRPTNQDEYPRDAWPPGTAVWCCDDGALDIYWNGLRLGAFPAAVPSRLLAPIRWMVGFFVSNRLSRTRFLDEMIRLAGGRYEQWPATPPEDAELYPASERICRRCGRQRPSPCDWQTAPNGARRLWMPPSLAFGKMSASSPDDANPACHCMACAVGPRGGVRRLVAYFPDEGGEGRCPWLLEHVIAASSGKQP